MQVGLMVDRQIGDSSSSIAGQYTTAVAHIGDIALSVDLEHQNDAGPE